MMKKLFIISALLFGCQYLLAQEWTIRYPSAHPSGYNHFHDGMIDEEGVAFLVGQEGADKDTPNAIVFRVNPDGTHLSYKHSKTGYYSKASCIVELPDEHLFVAGDLHNDTCHRLMTLIFDKNLNLLEERQYSNEVESKSWGKCRGVLDSHGNVIVATYIVQDNDYNGVFHRGVFFKFNQHGDTICHRYLIENEPNPIAYLLDFRVRQMWYREQSETLLCLVPGYGGVLSFISFDSAFNYIEEHQIWRELTDKTEHTLYRDCYTDHWYSEDEALFFSSKGAAETNKLRVSRVTTQGEILEHLPLNERADTIDDAAQPRCMAAPNDSTFYFSFHSHRWGYYPGSACVYQLNKQLEITGCHIDDDHDFYRTCLTLPSSDGGCITVNDSCVFSPFATTALPVIKKLRYDDFDRIPWSVTQSEIVPSQNAFPNPCNDFLHIPLTDITPSEETRCRVEDLLGHIFMDYLIHPDGNLLNLDVSKLTSGIYHYRIYSQQRTLLSEKFIKK